MALQLLRGNRNVRARAARLAVSCVAFGALVAACGSSSKSADTTPASASDRSTVAGAASNTARPQREYPAGGPTDPVFPPNDPAYQLLASGQCNELLTKTKAWGASVAAQEGASTTPLYMSAAYACLGRWNDAKRVFAQINLNGPVFSDAGACARAAVLQWLVALIDQRNQDATFSPTFVPSSSQSSCPSGAATTDGGTTTTGEATTTTTAAPSSTTSGP